MIDRVGNCRITEELASGGMAVIYRAIQETLNRPVAVKALKTAVSALAGKSAPAPADDKADKAEKALPAEDKEKEEDKVPSADESSAASSGLQTIGFPIRLR